MLFNLALVLAVISVAKVTAQTAVSQAVFDKIVRYNAFSAAAYADDCPTPPYGSSIVKFFNESATDTQAYLYRDSSANELILAFRGTATPSDLDTDFAFTQANLNLAGTSCSSCKVHGGFQDAYSKIASDVVSTINSAQGGSSLIVTGHSLGAGLASLASSSLAGQGKRLTTYTYGEPRNGDAAFTRYINSQLPNYYRVTHANDGIPQIPPTVLGFQHHGTEYWESKTDGNTASSTFACPGIEPAVSRPVSYGTRLTDQNCNAAADFGDNPINGAHIAYSNSLTANALFNAACGYVEP